MTARFCVAMIRESDSVEFVVIHASITNCGDIRCELVRCTIDCP